MPEKFNDYEHSIQLARKATPFLVAFGAVGLIVCSRIQFGPGAVGFGIIGGAGLLIVVLLVGEQLVTAWIATKRGRVSIANLLVVTLASALFFGLMRYSATGALVVLIAILLILAVSVESSRLPDRDKDSIRRESSKSQD